MQTDKSVKRCGINSNKFAIWSKDTPDPFITHIKNPLKSSLGKKVIISLLFSTQGPGHGPCGPIFFLTCKFEKF